jgi:hypothetical protein
MNNDKLLKGIEDDEILNNLKEVLKFTRENAQSIKVNVESRSAQLSDKLENYYQYSEPINTYDIDEVEKATERVETTESLSRKILALKKLSQKQWTDEKHYKEAMAHYFTYITPIMTDLESAKAKSRNKIAEIRVRYNKELSDATKEFNSYEDKVKELFEVAGEVGPYMYQVFFEKGFGRIARADHYAAAMAERYGKPSFELPQVKTPKITKHKSISGIEYAVRAMQGTRRK